MRFSIFTVLDHYPERRSSQHLFAENLEQIRLAEDLGYHTYWIAEHHFGNYGGCPSPALLLAAAASTTKRIGLGVATSVLPFHDPIRLAEDWSMLDVLSGGRLQLGLGSGYRPEEFAGFGVEGAEKRERFDEALDLMIDLMSGQHVEHNGKHFKFQGKIQVSPLQRPHPPMTIAILRPVAAYHVGRKGYDCMTTPSVSFDSPDEAKEPLEAFFRGAAESGRKQSEVNLQVTFPTYMPRDPANTRAEWEADLERYLSSRDDRREKVRFVDYDFYDRNRYLVTGSGDEAIETLKLWESYGMTEFMAYMNIGCMEHSKVCESMKRFAEQVIKRYPRD